MDQASTSSQPPGVLSTSTPTVQQRSTTLPISRSDMPLVHAHTIPDRDEYDPAHPHLSFPAPVIHQGTYYYLSRSGTFNPDELDPNLQCGPSVSTEQPASLRGAAPNDPIASSSRSVSDPTSTRGPTVKEPTNLSRCTGRETASSGRGKRRRLNESADSHSDTSASNFPLECENAQKRKRSAETWGETDIKIRKMLEV